METRIVWRIVGFVFVTSAVTSYLTGLCLGCGVTQLVRLGDQHQGALLAFFTLALVLVTAAYVLLTWMLLTVQREPALVMYLAPSERWPNTIDYIIKNTGGGLAVDVRWRLDGSDEVKERFAPLFNLGLFQSVSDMQAGEEIRSFLGTGVQLLQKPVPPPVKVTVTYRGQRAGERTETFVLDVTRFINLAPYTPPETEMAKSLKEISDSLKTIASKTS